MKLSLLLSFCVWISTESYAQTVLSQNSLEKNIVDNYQELLAEKVTNDLRSNYQKFLLFPNEYWDFLYETFLVNWNFDATTKALVGIEIFSSLSTTEFVELSRTLEVTLVRYAFESLPYYKEQKLNVVDVKINDQLTLAWLKINMDSPIFPDMHLDILLKLTDANNWKGVDFKWKGISYVNLKKNSYIQDFKNLKFHGLLMKLEEKNKVFFENLCRGTANYKDPKLPPCLLNYDK